MRKICVVTTGRWDLGYLWWVMKEIEASKKLQLNIILPKNHHDICVLETEFSCGYYAPEIHSINDYGNLFTDILEKLSHIKPNIFMVVGDTWHCHAAVTAATLLNIPIGHIHGGETTTGAFDDALRNSITMMSTYHFTANIEYAENVVRMIDSSKNVFNTGSPGLDWITRAKLKTKAELQKGLSIDLDKPFIIACFNPVTRELSNTEQQIKNMCKALDATGYQIQFILPNIDPCNNIITQVVKSYDDAGKYSDYMPHLWHCVDNLDHITYLSLLQYASMLVGNSSSGIIEAPSFNLPSVNIGTRQEGRIKGHTVVDVGYSVDEILEGIDKAERYNMRKKLCNIPAINTYGDGHSSKRIIDILESVEV